MDNCNKWQKRKMQKLAKRMYRICFDFTRRYFGVSLFFTKKKKKKQQKIYRAKFGKPVSKLARSDGINRCIICWLPWKRGLLVKTVFLAKVQGLRYLKLCLNPDNFTGLKEPEHQEKYISPTAKTEEMV